MRTRNFVVTGGSGFLGEALALKLRGLGHAVTALSRRANPNLEAAGVRTGQVDLSSDPRDFVTFFEGAEAVFHTAAHVKMWGPYDEFFRGNVIATRNVIEVCRRAGVPRLVFTSSPSVVGDGSDLCNVNETHPFPKRYLANYPKTKALAESEVLAANAPSLRTCALRPHLIFGPVDRNFVPMILERARRGRLIRVGAGKNLADFSFIEDCVAAHLLAEEALAQGGQTSGQAYFISQGEPWPLWDWINEVLRLNGLAAVARSLNTGVAQVLASMLEIAARAGIGPSEPLLTRFLVKEMATHHYFDISKARTQLGYSPKFTMRQALERSFCSANDSRLTALG